MYFFNSLKRHFSRLWPAAYHVCVFVDDGHHEGAVDVALQRRQRVKVGNERLLARKVIQQLKIHFYTVYIYIKLFLLSKLDVLVEMKMFTQSHSYNTGIKKFQLISLIQYKIQT
jgi:hypothetical protein